MKKRVLYLIIVILMFMLTASSYSFAGDPQMRSTASIGFYINRSSNTYVTADVDVDFVAVTNSYQVAVVLEEKLNGNWTNAKGLYAATEYFRGNNKSSVLVSKRWNVKSGKLYRIKCVSIDRYNNDSKSKSTSIIYSEPF